MSRSDSPTEITLGRDTPRFAWLLAALIASLALPALLQSAKFALPGLRLGLVAVLLGSLFAVSRGRRTLWVGVALAIPALALDWGSLVLGSRAFAMASSGFAILFLSLVVVAIVGALLRAQHVTTDTILGGICVYLLLGVLWVSAFSVLENWHPGSLVVRGEPLSASGGAPEPFRHAEILYFSFVTLTTLGYGDIVPYSPAAQALASGEAIVGQLYVAIFVARLVGLHLALRASKT